MGARATLTPRNKTRASAAAIPRAQPLRGRAGAVCETDRRPGFPIISEHPFLRCSMTLRCYTEPGGLNQPFDSEGAAGWTATVAERRVSTAGDRTLTRFARPPLVFPARSLQWQP